MIEMEFLTKQEEISTHGIYPGSRSIDNLLRNGLVILDKWQGPTSHDVSATVKKLLNLNKTGHSGTLDPNVSGILPITLENACKVMPALQKLDKEYVGVMHLHKEISNEEVKEIIKDFIGEIKQKPPLRSAVVRKERLRTIYSFEILDKKERDIAFLVKCEAGTYIRKLISDIGEKIGNAHLKELRRTRVGKFDESRSVKIQDLADAYHYWKDNGDESIRKFVLPVEAAIEHIKKIIVKDSAVYPIVNGSPLYTAGISKIEKGIKFGDPVAILSLKGELVALAKSNMSSEAMLKKGLAARTDRVIMEKGIYPKL